MLAHATFSWCSQLCSQWAKASPLSNNYSVWSGPMWELAHLTLLAAVGHLEFIGNTSIFTYRLLANMRVLVKWNPIYSILCRPIWHTHWAAHCVPDGPEWADCLIIATHEVGPCKGFCSRYFWLVLANVSPLEMSGHSYHGPIRVCSSAEIPLAEHNASPHNILIVPPIVLLMGQSDPIV